MRKQMAIGLCVLALFSSSPAIPIVQAESVTATNRVEELDEKSENPLTFKERLEKMKAEEEKEKVASIPAGHAYIPEDTILQVELTEEITSKKIHKGDPVPLVLQENVIINDVIVIPAGTEVEGIVTEAKKNGMFGRSGKLEFSINSVESINGVRIPL